MAKTSTLGSPGVEVIEKMGNAVNIETSTACTTYISGFAAQGPVEEVVSIGTMDDFTTVYGEPTNAAERYFYYSVKAIVDGAGAGTHILTSRLPYGEGRGDNVSTAYTILAYPSVPVVKNHKNKVGCDAYVLQAVSGAKNATVILDEVTMILDDATAALVGTSESTTRVQVMGLTFKADSSSTAGVAGAAVSGYFNVGNTEAGAKYTLTGAYGVEPAEDGSVKILAGLSVEDSGNNTVGSVVIKAHAAADLTDDVVVGTVELNYSPSHIEAKTIDGLVVASASATTAAEYGTADYDVKPAATPNKFDVYAKDVTHLVGAPVSFQLSLSTFASLVAGEVFTWSNGKLDFSLSNLRTELKKSPATETSCFGLYEALKSSAFIVLNTSRTTVNDRFEGFYLGMSDNMFVTPSDDYQFDAVRGVKVTTETVVSKGYDVEQGNGYHLGLIDSTSELGSYDALTRGRMGFDTDGNSQGSVSRILERSATTMDISGTEYDDTLSLGLFHLVSGSSQSSAANKLSFSLRERFNASLGRTRTKTTAQATNQVSYFIENVINPGETSNNLQVMVNPYIYDHIKLDSLSNSLHGKVRVFGTKLVSNVEFYQKKYVSGAKAATLSSYVADSNPQKAYSVVTNNVKNYVNLLEQAGVSHSLLAKLNSDETNKVSTFAKLDNLYAVGSYTTVANTSKIIGHLPYKLERALQLVANDEEYPDLDIVVDGGLTSIYPYSNGNAIVGDQSELIEGNTEEGERKQHNFVDTAILEGIEDMRTGKSVLNDGAQSVKQDWLSVEQTFLSFCNAQTSGGRGDSFFVGDVLRGILVKGKNTKVQNIYGTKLVSNVYTPLDNVNHSWSTSIYAPLKHLTDTTVSSYASLYAQWFMEDDMFSGKKVWVPASGYVTALMGACDQAYGPWYAAAGYNRGVITGPIDVALSPTQPQRTDLYKLCINSIPKMPNGGITVWGIRTMSKVDNVFDQNTCRRTFLYMEKRLKQYLRYYLFEPNTTYTRLNIYNDIEPFMSSIKAAGGIYSYKVVCNETNNTPEIINNGDLACDVSAAPTRTAENIVLGMTVNKYTGSVSTVSTL